MTRIRGDISKLKDTRQNTAGNLVQTNIAGSISPVHPIGIVGVAPIQLTFTFTGNATVTSTIYIENTHATQDLFLSLDGGGSYKTLVPGQNYGVDIAVSSVYVYGSGVGTTFELSYVYEPNVAI